MDKRSMEYGLVQAMEYGLAQYELVQYGLMK